MWLSIVFVCVWVWVCMCTIRQKLKSKPWWKRHGMSFFFAWKWKREVAFCIHIRRMCLCRCSPKLWHEESLQFWSCRFRLILCFSLRVLSGHHPFSHSPHTPHHTTNVCVWRQRNALRVIMVKLYVPELYFIPFDLHELIKTIVQRNERTNCKVTKNNYNNNRVEKVEWTIYRYGKWL